MKHSYFKRLAVGAMMMGSTLAMAADSPNKNIQGIIQWGAGGATDSIMRSVTPEAEKLLGTDVILTNRSGGVGAIATKYVNARGADGYTLLMGAENPQLYKVMGLADIDYSDMVPISILAQGISIIVARNDAPYDNVKEFIDYAKAHPKEIKVGSTGPGGLPSILLAILQNQEHFEVTNIPYNGDGPGMTALLGNAIDVMPTSYGPAKEYLRAGQMKIIGLMDKTANPELPGVKPVTDFYPELASQLPYSSFFGIFVKKGTPDEAVQKLSQAFNQSAASAEFKDLVTKRGFTFLGLSGDAANDYLERFRSVASWIVYDSGIAKHSPEEFNIKKISK